MSPRFFSDETDLGLAKRLVKKLPGQVVYPGHSDLPEVPRGCKDDEWLNVIGSRRLVVITRDKRIRTRPVLNAKWVRFQVRGFVFDWQEEPIDRRKPGGSGNALEPDRRLHPRAPFWSVDVLCHRERDQRSGSQKVRTA